MSKLKVPLLIIAILALITALVLSIFIMNRRKAIEEKFDKSVAALYPDVAETIKGKVIEDKIVLTEEKVKGTQATLKTTQENLVSMTQQRDATIKERDEARTETANVRTQLTGVQKELADKIDTLRLTENERDQARQQVAQLQRAVDELQPFQNRVIELEAKLKELPKQIEENKKIIAALQQENDNFGKKNKALEERIIELTTVPPDLAGSVVMSDPSWGFVILNVGRDDRVIEGTEFYVYRKDQLQGKIKVVAVAGKVSVADVIPSVTKSRIMAGDMIVYTKLAASSSGTAPAAAPTSEPVITPVPVEPIRTLMPVSELRSQPRQNFGPRR